MSRVRKIGLIVGGFVVVPLVIGLIAGLIIVQTEWFRNTVRSKIVTAVEDATGGRTEIGSFSFDWRKLRVQIRNFVIHGLEPAGAAPLFRASLLQVDLKLLSPFKGFVDVAYLLAETPQANIIVFSDGRTNVPAPKVRKPSDKSGLETIVDLAIGRFDLKNGSFVFAERKSAFDASGSNLRAQLAYNPLKSSYSGEVDLSPLFVQTGGNQPVHVDVKLPVTLEKDRISFANAVLATPQSRIVITGSMEHLVAPRTAVHINASIALEEVRRAAGLHLALDTAHAPAMVTADINAAIDENNRVNIRNANVSLGNSSIEASGPPESIQFNSTLALGELGRLFLVAARPEGSLKAGGTAAFRGGSDYRINANVSVRGVSARQGEVRLAGINLDGSLSADPHQIEMSGLRLAAFGGTFAGSAAVQELERFRVSGNLRNFDIDQVARTFMPGRLGYGGILSGPVAVEGSLEDTNNVTASANLAIAPAKRGIPVTGRLNVNYDGRAGNATLTRSYLQLPNTRLDLAGSLGQQIQAHLVSRNLNDFQPLGPLPVTLNNGVATVDATISGNLVNPRLAGRASVTNFTVEGRPFSRFTADLAASKSGAALSNAVLSRGTLEARISGNVGLRDWKPLNTQPVRADLQIRNADLADILALSGQASIPATGALSADAHIAGTVGSPTGSAELTVSNGTLQGEHFDSLSARAVLGPQSIDIPSLQLVAGPSRIDARATYSHALNELGRGNIQARITSNQVQLAQFQSLVKDRPGLRGVLSLNADVAAAVAPGPTGTEVTPSNVAGNFGVKGLELEGKTLGDLTATVSTASGTVQYNVNSDFAGSTIRVSGRSLLGGNHDTTATASITNLPIDRVLAVAGRRDLPVRGTLSAEAQVSGTLADPRGAATFNVTNAVAWDEPIDRLRATVNYTGQAIDVPDFRVDAAGSYVEMSGAFQHPVGDIQNGQVRFRVRSNEIQLSRLKQLQQQANGLGGVFEVNAEGAATLRANAAPLFSTLDARIAARNLSLHQKPLGNLTATAATSGREVAFNLTSDLAGSKLQGSGRMELTGDYPVNAQLTFNNVTYAGVSPLLSGSRLPLDAIAEGQVTVAGPMTRADALRGSLRLTKLEARSAAPAGNRKPRVDFELHNEGPIAASLDRGVVTIQNARITGPFTNLSVSGTAAVTQAKALNLRANGNVQLEVLEAFDPDLFASGSIVLNAGITGTTSKPVVNGRVQLQNASLNTLSIPNGLSNANGTLLFNGSEAVIQNLTGETGGGKLTVSGVVAYGGPEMQLRLQANADRVRYTQAESITVEADARLTLNGTTTRNLLSGNVSIRSVTLQSHTDIGSLLTSAATPPSTPTASTGVLGGMRFDIRIQTAPDVQFRTSLTRGLQADANLTLRGSPDHPGMLGRVQVTSGEVVFFGSKYAIDQGLVSFYDPQRINPVVNLDLSTNVQGIDVSIAVTGRMDRLKLSYRSDPPMLFSDLVSLLASGKAPTTDPVLAARQPVAPEQNFTQAGASTVLGQAVANPVSGRLQRLFGVTALKIDPQITGASNTPQATLTLQQQITRELTFTYIQDVTRSNPQIVRIEWSIDPHLSAIAQRDINGMFDLDFFYKKRFW